MVKFLPVENNRIFNYDCFIAYCMPSMDLNKSYIRFTNATNNC